MLMATAFTAFGKDNSKDSTNVANTDIVKGIERNDRQQAQITHCIEQLIVLDRIILETKTFKFQHDSIINIKDMRIATLQEGAVLDSAKIKEQEKLIKGGKRKVIRVAVGSATAGFGGGFLTGIVLWLKSKD